MVTVSHPSRTQRDSPAPAAADRIHALSLACAVVAAVLGILTVLACNGRQQQLYAELGRPAGAPTG